MELEEQIMVQDYESRPFLRVKRYFPFGVYFLKTLMGPEHRVVNLMCKPSSGLFPVAWID